MAGGRRLGIRNISFKGTTFILQYCMHQSLISASFRFMRPTLMQDPREIRTAIERALVEWYTVENGTPYFRRSVGAAKRLWAKNRSWELIPVKNFALWQTDTGEVELECESPEDRMEMYRWLKEPFQKNQVKNKRKNKKTATQTLSHKEEILPNSESVEQGAEGDPSEVADAASNLGLVRFVFYSQHSSPLDGDGTAQEERDSRIAKPSIEYTGLRGNIDLHNHDMKFTVGPAKAFVHGNVLTQYLGHQASDATHRDSHPRQRNSIH